MFAILAEDISDAEVLTHLVRRRLDDTSLTIKKKGYGGCAELCRKGARDLKAFNRVGIQKFIVCHDADRSTPEEIEKKVLSKIIRPSEYHGPCCIAVPVEEIESWIIADESAITKVIPTFRFKGHPNPETIPSPKEWLKEESRNAKGRPLYSPKTFNPRVALELDFDVVSGKCRSFRNFLTWLDNNRP